MRRTAAPAASDRIHDQITWAALQSYQPDTDDYAGQTRLALNSPLIKSAPSDSLVP